MKEIHIYGNRYFYEISKYNEDGFKPLEKVTKFYRWCGTKRIPKNSRFKRLLGASGEYINVDNYVFQFEIYIDITKPIYARETILARIDKQLNLLKRQAEIDEGKIL